MQAAYGGGANLRAAPNQASALVAFLPVGTRVEIIVRSQRPISGAWRSIDPARSSPGTRTVFLVRGSSSGRTRTSVVMRPLG